MGEEINLDSFEYKCLNSWEKVLVHAPTDRWFRAINVTSKIFKYPPKNSADLKKAMDNGYLCRKDSSASRPYQGQFSYHITDKGIEYREKCLDALKK